MNINQQAFSGFTATSTFLETGVYRKPKDTLFGFIDEFNKIWRDYSDTFALKLKEEYAQFLYLIDEPYQFKDKDGVFEGTIVEVLDSGLLVVERKGLKVHYNSKEIEFKL